MIRFKIDVADALRSVGFNSYKAKTTGLISQDTFKKVSNGDTNISLKSLNNLCAILDMGVDELIEYEPTEADEKVSAEFCDKA